MTIAIIKPYSFVTLFVAYSAMTYHFPDAYYGSNTKIRETLNNLVLRSPQEWQTSIGLPFVKIEGTVR